MSTHRSLAARTAVLVCIVASCTTRDRTPPLTVEDVRGFLFMEPPRANINVVMDAMLGGMNRVARAQAQARGDSTSVSIVAVDSSGSVVAGAGTNAHAPLLMVIYTDSAWAQLKRANARGLTDTVVERPDFQRDFVLVSWYPPVTLSNEMAYQSLDSPRLTGDTVEVTLSASFLPAANALVQTSNWQAKVWRVERGGARVVRVLTGPNESPATFALSTITPH